MQNKHELDSLTQVRAACHQVAMPFDHNPRQLVERFMKLQERYKDRFVSSEKKEGASRQQNKRIESDYRGAVSILKF